LQQSCEESRDTGSAGRPAQRLPSQGSRLLPWALVVLLTAAALAVFLFRGGGASPQALHLSVPLPAGTSLPPRQMGLLDVSADGRQVALVLTDTQGRRLYLETLDDGRIVPLEGTEQAISPFFSPDGRWLGFFAGGKLKKVSTQGGRPFTICNTAGNNRGASWGEDDRIIFAAHYTEALKQVPAGGGSPEPFSHLDEKQGERTHRWPQVVPGEDLVLFTVGTMDSPESYDAAHIDALIPSTGRRKTVLEGASMARYLPTGHLLFAREGFLFAVPFDTRQLTTSGTPVPVLENVKTVKASGLARAAFSSTGTLIYLKGGAEDLRTRLVWRFLDGHSEPLDAPMDEYTDVALSPDGSRLAVAIRGDTVFDIWIQNIQAGGLTRLTFEGDNRTPVWTPDGQRISYSSVRHNKLSSVYIKAADGTGEAELLYDPGSSPGSGGAQPESWSPNGLWLAMASNNLNGYNISLLSTQDGTEKPFLQGKGAELFAAFSPDGRWMAYASDESGRTEVYVRPFPGPGGKRQISRQGGLEPYWSRDGKDLFFRRTTALYRAHVDTRTGFRAGNPEQVLDDLPDAGQTLIRQYTLHPDGRRLLTLETRAGRSERPSQVNFVSHWFDEIRAKINRD
ncbi:MAG: TolB family protein, partial [Acidobacteriota bacterium]